MAIFMSYSRDDEAIVDVLVRGFKLANREVWSDHRLEAGQAWWDTILEQIRSADVFLFAMSDRSLASKPCLAELDYARALQRPILPVEISPVTTARSNLLAGLQHVVFRQDDVTTAFDVLAAADRAAQRVVPLPDPRPPEPAVPFAYLGEIREKIDSGTLDPPGQLEVIEKLQRSLGEETDASARADIVAMLKAMLDSPWRTVAADHRIRFVLLARERFEDEIAGRTPGEPEIPPGLAESVPTAWSEDSAREAVLDRIYALVDDMQEGRARQEARHVGESTTAQPDPPWPDDGAQDGIVWEPSRPAPAPEWAFRVEPEEPTDFFAGVGSAEADEPAREKEAAGHTGSTTVTTKRPAPSRALMSSYALAVAALVVSAAFAVLAAVVGRGGAVAIFALPAAAGLVAVGTSAAAAKRAAADKEAGAARLSILGIVWGVVGVAVAVAALAILLNNPTPM